tara:strand:+ start:194 stop:502 length:309 start_codon:yes stop_codon:yes gene_type:complete
MSSVMIALIAALLALLASWQEYYEYARDAFLEDNDPDDWVGREAEYCIAQEEYACEYADDACADDDDDDDDDDDGPRSDGQGDKWESNEEWIARFGIEPWEV